MAAQEPPQVTIINTLKMMAELRVEMLLSRLAAMGNSLRLTQYNCTILQIYLLIRIWIFEPPSFHDIFFNIFCLEVGSCKSISAVPVQYTTKN